MPPVLTPRATASAPSAPPRPPGRVGRLTAPVADLLVRSDLPGLPSRDRAEVVAFVTRRTDGLPTPLLLGVALAAALFRSLLAAPGGSRLVLALCSLPLPLVGEYPRLLRSLSLAFVFETWPDRRADGSQPA